MACSKIHDIEKSFEEHVVDKARKSPEILSSLVFLECEV